VGALAGAPFEGGEIFHVLDQTSPHGLVDQL
jgi:hypothetical protein